MLRRATALISLSLLSACGSPQGAANSIDGTFVGETPTEAIILRLAREDDGTVSGNVGVATLNYQEQKIDLSSKFISGRSKDQFLFLTVHGDSYNSLDAPVNAEWKGDDLIIRAPGGTASLKLSRATQADYDKLVNTLAANLTANDVGLLPDN